MNASTGHAAPESVALVEQRKAQEVATRWADSTGHGDMAVRVWDLYQNPDTYKGIQGMLRKPDYDPKSFRIIESAAERICREAAYVSPFDLRLYRGIRGEMAQLFTPGEVFTEPGFSSTTPKLAYAQGWLPGLPGYGEIGLPDPNSVVLEIHVPKGKPIVGGDRRVNLETMIPPGAHFKVISKERRTAQHPDSPISPYKYEPFSYTHVVSELL